MSRTTRHSRRLPGPALEQPSETTRPSQCAGDNQRVPIRRRRVPSSRSPPRSASGARSRGRVAQDQRPSGSHATRRAVSPTRARSRRRADPMQIDTQDFAWISDNRLFWIGSHGWLTAGHWSTNKNVGVGSRPTLVQNRYTPGKRQKITCRRIRRGL